eukprot:366278-Chlamydomonas_euryale.AAC.65
MQHVVCALHLNLLPHQLLVAVAHGMVAWLRAPLRHRNLSLWGHGARPRLVSGVQSAKNAGQL